MVSLEEGKSKRGNRKVRGTLGVREKNSVLQSNEMKLKKKILIDLMTWWSSAKAILEER